MITMLNETPIEFYTSETDIIPNNEYEIKFCFDIKPIPLLSNISAILIQLMNEGENKLRSFLETFNCYAEIKEKDNWWEWEIPYISVKKVWFKYRFIPRPKTMGLALPTIPLVLLAKYVIAGIIVLAGILIAWMIIKVGVYMVRLTPITASALWIIVLGVAAFGGIWLVKELVSMIGD